MERLPLRESVALALSLLAACTPGSCEGSGDRLPASERQPVTDESPAPVRAARDDLPLAVELDRYLIETMSANRAEPSSSNA